MKRIIGGMLAAAMLSGCSAVEEAVSTPSVEEYNCDQLGKDAAALGENNLGIELIKVRELRVTQDNRSDYVTPSGADEVVLLQCKGTGVFSNGMKNPVKLEATIDSDEDTFISWQAME